MLNVSLAAVPFTKLTGEIDVERRHGQSSCPGVLIVDVAASSDAMNER